MPRERILIVEDEGIAALSLENKIRKLGYESAGIAFTSDEALKMAHETNLDLILMDIQLARGKDGIETAQEIQRDLAIPIIYVTAFSDDGTIERAKITSPFGYLVKPFNDQAIKTCIEIALNKHREEKNLRKSNEKLKQFTSMASHDLRAPARTTTTLTGLLAKDYGPQFDEHGRELMDCIVTESAKMQSIVEDLLEYSRVSSSREPRKEVALESVIKSALSTLASEIQERKAEVVCGPLPTIQGNATQLQRLFCNLIGNALKYNRRTPKIVITSSASPSRYEVAIADNGIGIPADEIDKVFEMFHRGQSSGEFAGTGIGLASCKVIMENHDGKIWATSKVDEGTTFFLWFPR